METELLKDEARDAQSVSAVRSGDVERYRELVERHERRVYAVAWSRLGDAVLAEEATQEAFIRAYRRLWLLGDGAKFSGWINTIARRVAINFGLRHRRELNKRERWAIESAPENPQDSDSEQDSTHTPEMLRRTLAELPAAHRECLVLFYLEGKSGVEAAAALGISEAALRVRLHRARAALREQLESKLEGSLSKLRPAKTLVPAVMAGVLASSSAKAATAGGVGAAILGTLAKFAPFKWLFFLFPFGIPMITMMPALLLQQWVARDEHRNYRDPKGFRAAQHQEMKTKRVVISLGVILGVLFFMIFMTRHFPLKIYLFLGTKGIFLIIGSLTFMPFGFVARQLEINRSREQIFTLANCLLQCMIYVSVGFGWLPVFAIFPTCLASSALTVAANRSRRLRMDYNFFLRATQGLLPQSDVPETNMRSMHFDRSTLRAFARFLGERQLVNNFRWSSARLVLFLPPIKPNALKSWQNIFPSMKRNSNLTLGWDGLVEAHCGSNDKVALPVTPNEVAPNSVSMEEQVVAAVSGAWQHFRKGNNPAAERAIGQIPDSDIFIVPSSRTRANRWQRFFLGACVVFFVLAMSVIWFFQEKLSGLEPVSATEPQVRAFMNDTTPSPDRKKSKSNSPFSLFYSGMVLPPTNLFSPEGLCSIRKEIFRDMGLVSSIDQEKWEPSWLVNAAELRWAITRGWFDWNSIGLKPQEVGDYIHQNKKMNEIQFKFEYLLTRVRAWSWVDNKGWDVQRVNIMTLNQLRWLREVNCLDLVDREKFIQQIASIQVLSGTSAPGEPTIHDWRDVRGLFFTPCSPALQDTYISLAALEILGGLDRIDREQCIRGILRRHQGKGFFTSPDSGSINEYHIEGDVLDTFSAFESLRILGALDRVKDLDHWKFRPRRRHLAKDQLTWNDVQAWVCEQRLKEILRARKENPAAPVRSLLQP